MVFQIISLVTAFVGSSIAAAWDLKTTEIPDHIPHAMIAIALVTYAVQSLIESNFWPIGLSLITGAALFALGFLMYKTGQWGGGDAKILAAVGFLLPQPTGFAQTFFPFPVSYLINVFLVGAVYMLLYALVLALLNRKIISSFANDLKSSSKLFGISSLLLFSVFIGLNFFLSSYFGIGYGLNSLLYNSFIPLLLTMGIFFIWKFAKAVEKVGFTRKIPISKLRVGDVLFESKVWEGITKKQLNKIKKSGKKLVWIKEGVRFAPAFPLALVASLYFGDLILMIRFLV